MNFWQFVIFVLIPSGVIGAISSSLVMYASNKKLDTHRRIMEERKRVYGEVNELFQGVYNTAQPEERKKTTNELLRYYRAIQIWGSDAVVRKFSELLFALDKVNNISQEIQDKTYKEFIIVMRRDLLNKTQLEIEEVKVYGRIS